MKHMKIRKIMDFEHNIIEAIKTIEMVWTFEEDEK